MGSGLPPIGGRPGLRRHFRRWAFRAKAALGLYPNRHSVPFCGRTVSFPVHDSYTLWWFGRYRGVNENGWHEPSLTRLLERLASDRRCLVDVGAHLGYFSALFASAPGHEAHAIELDPANFAYLSRGLADTQGIAGTVTPVHLGLADQDGEVVLDSSKASPMASLAGAGDAATGAGRPVRITTLDRFCRELGLVPDVVKIDVEGYERDVWRGGQAILAAARPVVIIEIHTPVLQERGIDIAAFFEEIRAMGYRTYSWADHRAASPEQLIPLAAPRALDNYDIVCLPPDLAPGILAP